MAAWLLNRFSEEAKQRVRQVSMSFGSKVDASDEGGLSHILADSRALGPRLSALSLCCHSVDRLHRRSCRSASIPFDFKGPYN